jgi:acyl dehydratase
MTVRVFATVADLHTHAGGEIGVSDWLLVSQEQINAFADVTGDHQWIHVDPERAAASDFGGTIAHGYYTLSITPVLAATLYQFEGFRFAINYGADRLRFPAPLRVGSRVRLRAHLLAVDNVPGGVQTKVRHTFEAEAAPKPACIADVLFRLYP